MKSTIEELGPTRVRMAIEVPWGDLDHAFGEVYKELGKQVRVPGFRPGKVPNRVLDQRIGRPVVLEQVVQHAIPEVYSEVVRENQVRVLGQPDIEVTRLDDNDTLAFTAEVDVAPQLELPALENLAVTVDDVEVTDEEIDQQVSVMRERFGMLTGVERPAEDGDFVSIDLEAKLNGEVLEDGSTTGMSYEVGSGNLMEGLDDAVRGLSADESKTFQTALLSGPNAGESADVTVTVRSVKTKDLPELDDEFAQTASEFDTLAELRDDVRTRLARTKTLGQGAQARDKLVEHLIEVVEVPVPENLVEREIEWRNRAFEQELQQAGMDWDAFLSISGVESREAYDADQRKTVEEAVRTQFILDAIADAREVTVDNDGPVGADHGAGPAQPDEPGAVRPAAAAGRQHRRVRRRRPPHQDAGPAARADDDHRRVGQRRRPRGAAPAHDPGARRPRPPTTRRRTPRSPTPPPSRPTEDATKDTEDVAKA